MNDAGPGTHADDPRPLVEAAFARIHAERMAGLPIVHPALRVEALPFVRWSGLWIGALVTPWAINLLLLRAPGGRWVEVQGSERAFYRLPGGVFGFLAGDEPDLGPYQSCSLVSPLTGFADQGVAVAAAREMLRLLFEPAGHAAAPRRAAPDPAKRRFLARLAGRRSAA